MRFWPRSLFGRLALILSLGLCLAQLLSLGLVFWERTQSQAGLMINYLARDVASAVSILERIPADERGAWLPRLARRNYRYEFAEPRGAEQADTELSRRIAASISAALGTRYNVIAKRPAQRLDNVLLYLQLSDGTPLAIDLSLSTTPLASWMLWIFALQFVVLLSFGWLTIRVATRPLAHLAQAADALGHDLKTKQLREDGPVEVARAARAFNSMQGRISDYMSERMRILAAISHDLQTPITRLRLRAELAHDEALREKLLLDLDAMQTLVQEGIAYARDGQGVREKPAATDIDALLQSVAGDYADAGKIVRVHGRIGRPFVTQPHALLRIITNLLDNALKFATDPEIHAALSDRDELVLSVCDHGPGIPENELEAAMQPYYRVETSRNRETGGTGLGLAIAQQLALAMGGTLTLSNLAHGGLQACLVLTATERAPLECDDEVPPRSARIGDLSAVIGSSGVGRAGARRHHGNANRG